MWSIVIFSDNKCAAVPSHWFANDLCAWPKPITKNRSKLLVQRAIPNKFDFDYFPARRLHTEKPIGKNNCFFFL